MVVLAFLTDPQVGRRILAHLGLPTSPPPIAPPRAPDEALAPEFEDHPTELPNDVASSYPPQTAGRDPPFDR